jgi:PIN domain nuclease of toxin-antitoxin system
LRLLLDTHILLWIMQGSSQLPRSARQRIDAADEVFVSSVSLWEASIKVKLGKLKVDMDRLEDLLRSSPFVPLPVNWSHARALRQLPPLHADPFDRMLVAQAMNEPLNLLTRDAALAAYSPLVIVV